MFGVYMSIIASVVHHVHIGVNIRDWNIAYTSIYLISLAFIPITLAYNDAKPYAIVHGATFSYIMRE